MNPRTLIPAVAIALLLASPVFASEITGTLTAGAGSSVGGTVVGDPSASPAPGDYDTTQSVSLSAPGSSSIRYTVDGSMPSCAGGGLLYTAPITVAGSLTIQAVSCYASGASSSVGSYSYVISGGSLSGSVTTSSGGSLSGTVVAPPSGGSLSGTVTSSPGGSLSGTVVAPPASSGSSGSSGGGGGGGGNGPPIGTVTTTGGGGGGGGPTGEVLGASTTVPNLPNTGAGGDALRTMFILALSALIAVYGSLFLRYRIR